MFKVDRKEVLESIIYANKSFKLNSPENATIMIGFSLLDSLHTVVNSYGYTDNHHIIDELRRLLPRVSRAIVKGRPKEVEFYIKEFKKQFVLLKEYLTLRKLQNQIYFKRFSKIVIHYILLYKRMKRLAIQQLRKMLK